MQGFVFLLPCRQCRKCPELIGQFRWLRDRKPKVITSLALSADWRLEPMRTDSDAFLHGTARSKTKFARGASLLTRSAAYTQIKPNGAHAISSKATTIR